ncbi:MAG: hypothetical protein SFU99_16535 [Saprospiraceae bacterium]|nr:hypothetical protein [Saprospiraceae bacterium]
MLTLFRTNQLLFSVLLLFYAAILHIGVFVNPPSWQPSGYGFFSKLIYDAIGSNGLVPDILAIILLFIQAVAINIITANHRIAESVSLFPGLFYILIASALPEFLHLSPLHLANTFYIIALSELLKIYKKPSCANNIFNVGFWLAIATLFYPSYAIFLPLGLLGVNVLRAFNIKEWLMVAAGFLVPYILSGTVLLWINDLNTLINLQFTREYAFLNFRAYEGYEVYFKIAFYDLFLLIAIFSYSLYVFKKVMQVQKKINVLYWALLLSGFTLFFQAGIQLDHLLVLAVPLGMLISLNFQSIANRWAESFHLLILIIVLFFQYQEFLLPK